MTHPNLLLDSLSYYCHLSANRRLMHKLLRAFSLNSYSLSPFNQNIEYPSRTLSRSLLRPTIFIRNGHSGNSLGANNKISDGVFSIILFARIVFYDLSSNQIPCSASSSSNRKCILLIRSRLSAFILLFFSFDFKSNIFLIYECLSSESLNGCRQYFSMFLFELGYIVETACSCLSVL